MELSVDELAARADLSVDTVRFYQARGLLPPPARSGRRARYSPEHLQRLERIRELKARGLNLAAIALVLERSLVPADGALLAALAGPPPGDGEQAEVFGLEEFAARSGLPGELLAALAEEGLVIPGARGGAMSFTEADLSAAAAGMALLEEGLPLDALLALARDYAPAARRAARKAVELFEEHVRAPALAGAASEEEATERLVDALTRLLPATTALVAHHFRRLLIEAARERMEQR